MDGNLHSTRLTVAAAAAALRRAASDYDQAERALDRAGLKTRERLRRQGVPQAAIEILESNVTPTTAGDPGLPVQIETEFSEHARAIELVLRDLGWQDAVAEFDRCRADVQRLEDRLIATPATSAFDVVEKLEAFAWPAPVEESLELMGRDGRVLKSALQDLRCLTSATAGGHTES